MILKGNSNFFQPTIQRKYIVWFKLRMNYFILQKNTRTVSDFKSKYHFVISYNTILLCIAKISKFSTKQYLNEGDYKKRNVFFYINSTTQHLCYTLRHCNKHVPRALSNSDTLKPAVHTQWWESYHSLQKQNLAQKLNYITETWYKT